MTIQSRGINMSMVLCACASLQSTAFNLAVKHYMRLFWMLTVATYMHMTVKEGVFTEALRGTK